MTGAIDPYHRWLGIPPAEQPPHHYRLLGVSPFETDLAVIGSAADRQTVHVKSFLAGPDASAAERLLAEIGSARMCLFDPARRAEYDLKLRARLTAAEVAHAPFPANVDAAANQAFSRPLPRAAEAPPIAKIGTECEPIEPPPRQATDPKRLPPDRKSRISFPLFAVGGLAALVLAIVAALAIPGLFGSKKKPTEITGERKHVESPAVFKRTKDVKKSGVQAPSSVVPAAPEVPLRSLADEASQSFEVSKSPGSVKYEYSLDSPLGEGLDSKAPPDPDSPAASFKLVLLGARQALATRDLEMARALLAKARESNRSPLDRAESQHLETLEKYLAAFWQSVRLGLDQVKAGEKFTFETEEYELVKRSGEAVVYKVGGLERDTAIHELDARAAAAFAAHARQPGDPLALVQAGAFLALDQRDPSQRQWQTAHARQLWHEAAELGKEDRCLAKELGIDLSARPQRE